MTKIDKRKSPENIARLKSQGFQPGQEKHPGSGRQKVPDEVKGKLSELTDDAIEAIAELLTATSTSDDVRLRAASLVLAPFVSKAPREIKISQTVSVSDMLAEATKSITTIDASFRVIEPSPEIENNAND